MTFVGVVEDSDVYDGENSGAAASLWPETGEEWIFSYNMKFIYHSNSSGIKIQFYQSANKLAMCLANMADVNGSVCDNTF